MMAPERTATIFPLLDELGAPDLREAATWLREPASAVGPKHPPPDIRRYIERARAQGQD